MASENINSTDSSKSFQLSVVSSKGQYDVKKTSTHGKCQEQIESINLICFIQGVTGQMNGREKSRIVSSF